MPVETFQPELLGSSANPTITYGTRSGRWMRIGNLIHVEGRVDWTATSGGSGNLQVNMPGVPSAVSSNFSGLLNLHWMGINLPNNILSLAARLRPSETVFELIGAGDQIPNAAAMTTANMDPAGRITFAGTFITA